MSQPTMPIELLAPAKDLESGCAAIDCGADALYVGPAKFGAREAAGNTLSDIAALIKYAHVYHAKVYATLNTILRDEEIGPAVSLCHELADAGVDGLIVQDMGLLECDLPPLPLIASTQTHNYAMERVRFLGDVGFSRVILARELSLPAIKRIHEATPVELEVFVHGALCVCLSGQCYLSHAIGGRSGNRGQCAQPCRRAYSLLDQTGAAIAEKQHLLSLRDLDLSNHLGALLDAGVTSFKIEGRLKNKAYVMNVVGHYRRTLDPLLAGRGLKKASLGEKQLGFDPDPNKTFNRGYSTYFLHGRGAAVASPQSPKHVGEPLGKVTRVDRGTITVDTREPLHPGDGITYFHGGKGHPTELDGSVVNRVVGQRLTLQRPAVIPPGTRVFRNHDQEFVAALKAATPKRTLGLRLMVGEKPGGICLRATCEDGVTSELLHAGEKESARHPEAAREQIQTQLAKLGDTRYRLDGVAWQWASPWFLPLSRWNELRRQLITQLDSAREHAWEKPHRKFVPTDHPFPQNSLTYAGNVLNTKAAAFYRRHGVTDITPAAEAGTSLTNEVVMTTKFCLKYEQGHCPRVSKIIAPPEPWCLVDDEGRRLPLRFRCDLPDCVMEITYPGA